MSLVMMEGFEATLDQSDLTVQKGWMCSQANNIAGNTSIGIPSRTGIAGTGLMLKGPYSNSAALPMASANAPDFGMNVLNQSVYTAWQSGGFCLGVNATFNKTTQVEIAPYYSNQIAYDGVATYWAVGCINGTNTPALLYSTDLKNWTQTQVAPPQLTWYSGVAVGITGGTTYIAVFNNCYDENASSSSKFQQNNYYTTNGGVTWTEGQTGLESYQWTLPTGLAWYYGQFYGMQQSTALAGYPCIPYALQTVLSAFNWQQYVSVDTTANYYNASGGTGTYSNFSISRVKQGFLCMMGIAPPTGFAKPYTPGSQGSSWSVASNATWQASSINTNGTMVDICYLQSQNLWVACGYGGIYTLPGSGAAPSLPSTTAAWSWSLNTGSSIVWSIDTNGSVIVAVGQDPLTGNGCIWTSTNGTTWAKADRFLWSGVGGTAFRGVFWDGHQFVLTGQLNAASIATSTDGVNWTPVYYPDYNEVTVASPASLLGVYAGIEVNNAFVPWSTGSSAIVGAGLLPTAVAGSGNNSYRTITPNLIEGNGTPVAQTATQSVPLSSGLSHFYELIFTAVPGSPNQFTVQYAIDSAVIGSLNGGNPIQLAGSGDTGTAWLFVNLPRNGQFTVVDDMYVTNFATDAAGAQGQLGLINIINDPFSGDAQDQFSTSAITGTHAAVVNTPLSNSEGYIYSATQGQQDVYTTNPAIPANYRVQAVQVEGYFQKYAGAGANGAVGVKSGSASATGSQGAGTGFGTGYSQLIQSTDPATGAAWTAAGLQAMKVTVTKTT